MLSVPYDDPCEAETKFGPLVRVRVFDELSVNISVNVIEDKVVAPLFVTVIT